MNPEQFDVYISQIEREQTVSVLGAWISGSHAWGLESPDSDVDIRFVYVQPIDRYVSPSGGPSSIQSSDESASLLQDKQSGVDPVPVELHGWDVGRFLDLLSSDNPSVLEAGNSPLPVYEPQPLTEMIEHVSSRFNPISLFNHYQSMAKRHYHKYICSEEDAPVKRVLYGVRSSLYAEHVRIDHTLPDLSFPDFLNSTPNEVLEGWSIDQIHRLVSQKQEGTGGEPAEYVFESEIKSVANHELNYEQHIPENQTRMKYVDKKLQELLAEKKPPRV